MMRKQIFGQNGGIVTGLHDRELIYGHNIVFPENVSYEDNYWGVLIRHYVKNSYRIERPSYHAIKTRRK